jgi:hypothetical protein
MGSCACCGTRGECAWCRNERERADAARVIGALVETIDALVEGRPHHGKRARARLIRDAREVVGELLDPTNEDPQD